MIWRAGVRPLLRGKRLRSLSVAVFGVLLVSCATASASQQTQSFRYGPIAMNGYETREPAEGVSVPSPPLDGYLTAMHAIVVDGAGRPVPQTQVMLHHAVFVNDGRFPGDRTSDYCGVRPREPFYGTAEEDSALRLPAGYGYPIHNRDRWRLRYMLMNHKAPHRQVYIRYTVTTESAAMVPVTPYWISVACQVQRIYNVPGGGAAGSNDVRSAVWHVPASGRIVALAGHLHGGGRQIALRQIGCADRTLATSSARYGSSADPIYSMSPMLHEPSPRSVSVPVSETGWAVHEGEAIRVDSVYDNSRPHVKVMGIAHVYVARTKDPGPAACPPLPTDVVDGRLPFLGAPGRPDPPMVNQDLSRRDADGVGHAIPGLGGPPLWSQSNLATVNVRRFAFAPQQLSIKVGTTVRWRFQDRQRHDVSWVRGPRGFASRYLKRGEAYSETFTAAGTYSYFCSLHPVDMPATIVVRP
ncbi:MAG: hypothetical protein JWM31_1092 [Solirubrobacterales bacterium]|nr:hypothetical protein [Solirubrobacterales bacterium]